MGYDSGIRVATGGKSKDDTVGIAKNAGLLRIGFNSLILHQRLSSTDQKLSSEPMIRFRCFAQPEKEANGVNLPIAERRRKI